MAETKVVDSKESKKSKKSEIGDKLKGKITESIISAKDIIAGTLTVEGATVARIYSKDPGFPIIIPPESEYRGPELMGIVLDEVVPEKEGESKPVAPVVNSLPKVFERNLTPPLLATEQKERMVRLVRETNDYRVVEKYDEEAQVPFYEVTNKRNDNMKRCPSITDANLVISMWGMR